MRCGCPGAALSTVTPPSSHLCAPAPSGSNSQVPQTDAARGAALSAAHGDGVLTPVRGAHIQTPPSFGCTGAGHEGKGNAALTAWLCTRVLNPRKSDSTGFFPLSNVYFLRMHTAGKQLLFSIQASVWSEEEDLHTAAHELLCHSDPDTSPRVPGSERLPPPHPSTGACGRRKPGRDHAPGAEGGGIPRLERQSKPDHGGSCTTPSSRGRLLSSSNLSNPRRQRKGLWLQQAAKGRAKPCPRRSGVISHRSVSSVPQQ